MSDGVVVISGVFTPGSVVTLVKVPSERVLRAEGGEEVERRVADENGTVGFAGLELGDRFFATAYIDGVFVEKRAVAIERDTNSAELLQASPAPIASKLGVAGETVEPVPPAEPEDDLEVGVATGKATSKKPAKRAAKK